ncbi:protein FAR1-RELATED SEQUENCE 5-like [Apium graveolens]|uniref:protein FAR1-RELATED SEQUENCE 5-like n=1 Tax=Apium graveolens TaxID=4045 RepID=UPI003D78F8F9
MGPKFRDCSSCGDSCHISRLVGDYVSNGGNSLSESEISVSRFNITHGGHKYYIPKYSGDISKPEVNQSFDSLEKGIEFYKEYGRLSRFNVRLNIEMKDDRDEIILRKYIICGRAGFNDLPRNLDESSSKIVKRRRTVSGRSYWSDKYVIAVFEEKHNHPLASEEGLQFLKANREMTNRMR